MKESERNRGWHSKNIIVGVQGRIHGGCKDWINRGIIKGVILKSLEKLVVLYKS